MKNIPKPGTDSEIGIRLYDLEPQINSIAWGCDVLSVFLAQSDEKDRRHMDGISWITEKIKDDVGKLQIHYREILRKK